MRVAQQWKLSLCAALCLSVAAFLPGCGGSEPPQPDPAQARRQAEQLAAALQEKEDLQMRLARMEQRLSNLEQGQDDIRLAQTQPPALTPLDPAAQPRPSSTPPQISPQVSPQVSPQTLPPQGMAPRRDGLTQVPLVPETPAPALAPAAPNPSAPAASRPAGRAPAIPPDYQRALSLLVDQEKPAEARTAFSVFLTDNPNGPFTPNALYWVGETYYAEKKYADAILFFKDVAARFPKHDKAPDALYKASLAYRQLGDAENAAFLEKLLREDYPGSRVAGLLKQRGG